MVADEAVPAPRQRRGTFLRELLETALLTAFIFVVVRVALQNFRVDGESMEPNLHNNEYILVNKVDYLLHAPQRGDIIVFRAVPAGQPDRDFIKRVIGVPGDTVSVHNLKVWVNGKALSEPYISQPPDYSFPQQKVPPNTYFVLGDNRNNSYDSSKWPTPFLPRSDIIGRAWISYWPPSDLTWIGGPSL
jgi:signal peptidase I